MMNISLIAFLPYVSSLGEREKCGQRTVSGKLTFFTVSLKYLYSVSCFYAIGGKDKTILVCKIKKLCYVFIRYRRFSTVLESIPRKKSPYLKMYCIASIYLTTHDYWLSHNFKQSWSCKSSFRCHGIRSLNTLICIFYFVGELICFMLIMSTVWQV